MNKDYKFSAAACRSNIAFYKAECIKFTKLAQEASLEQQRFELMLKMIEDPEGALEELSNPEPNAETGYN